MVDGSSGVPTVALVGHPNCGKTALFNALTGGNAKVGNYPGVTVERKEGEMNLPDGRRVQLLDLPGTYSLDALSMDEQITCDVLLGNHPTEKIPSLLIAVVDATNLERGLGLILEVKELGIPLVLALNMVDLAQGRGQSLDLKVLAQELGMPVVSTVAVRKQGIIELIHRVQVQLPEDREARSLPSSPLEQKTRDRSQSSDQIRQRFAQVDRILKKAVLQSPGPSLWTDRLDRIVLHPVWGTLLLGLLLALMFQALFAWAAAPMDAIRSAMIWVGEQVTGALGPGPLQSLLVDGVIVGVGSVLVFLPQILILFALIAILEDSGYLSRAAFLMDRLMNRVGLHGRAFLPLLSSMACAIPGILSTRTIENRRDRLTTILVAPLMTCSARLPVYSLLIGAFIPDHSVYGPIRLRGLVLFGLYCAGVVAALAMAWVFKRFLFPGATPPLLLELPTYKVPQLQTILRSLLERARLFVQKAGSVILVLSILLWFLVSYPKPPLNATEPAIVYSYAGTFGRAIEPLLRPIGLNWKIAVALVPGFAAREVMIGSLATVYAVEGNEDLAQVLGGKLAQDWSLATALSLLVWYVLACQCLSTLAVTRRETQSWRWPVVMFSYMTVLAYLASFGVYQLACFLGYGP
ncbi:MAG: ferrous iron transporter B [Bdellovibrionia bacterium]